MAPRPRKGPRRPDSLPNLNLEVEMTNAAAPYAPGDPVRVVDGPFADFAGVIREVDASQGELTVDVTMFGRPVPIRTEPWQVTPR